MKTSAIQRRILIMSPLGDQAQAVARCIKQHRTNDALSFGSIIEGETFVEPSSKTSAVRWQCSDPLREFDLVLPTGAPCTSALLRRFGSLTVGAVTMSETSLRWFDKPWSLAFAVGHGVSIPQTWHCADDIPENFGPIFYKPGIEGVAGERTWVHSAADLPDAISKAESGFIFQERIEGAEVHSFGFLADRGRILVGRGFVERLSYPPSGGSAAIMDVHDDPRLRDRAERLIMNSHYSGWGLVEFKFCTRRDDYVLMEINPKLWASVELALRTEPLFMKLLFDIDVPAETITRMWWPNRLFRMGITHWPRHMNSITGAQHARERLSEKAVIAALFPYHFRRKFAALQSRSQSSGASSLLQSPGPKSQLNLPADR